MYTRAYTDNEVELLHKLAPLWCAGKITDQEMERAMGRNISALRAKCRYEGISLIKNEHCDKAYAEQLLKLHKVEVK